MIVVACVVLILPQADRVGTVSPFLQFFSASRKRLRDSMAWQCY